MGLTHRTGLLHPPNPTQQPPTCCSLLKPRPFHTPRGPTPTHPPTYPLTPTPSVQADKLILLTTPETQPTDLPQWLPLSGAEQLLRSLAATTSVESLDEELQQGAWHGGVGVWLGGWKRRGPAWVGGWPDGDFWRMMLCTLLHLCSLQAGCGLALPCSALFLGAAAPSAQQTNSTARLRLATRPP